MHGLLPNPKQSHENVGHSFPGTRQAVHCQLHSGTRYPPYHLSASVACHRLGNCSCGSRRFGHLPLAARSGLLADDLSNTLEFVDLVGQSTGSVQRGNQGIVVDLDIQDANSVSLVPRFAQFSHFHKG